MFEILTEERKNLNRAKLDTTIIHHITKMMYVTLKKGYEDNEEFVVETQESLCFRDVSAEEAGGQAVTDFTDALAAFRNGEEAFITYIKTKL